MDKLFILIAVFVLLLLFNKREQFNNSNSKKLSQSDIELRRKKCDHTTKLISNINMYVDKTCQEREAGNRVINNDRLTCRNFIDKQLYIGKDNKGWCNDDNVVPVKKMEGQFVGFNKLDHNIEKLGTRTESKYPFNLNMIKTDLPNLNNKN